MRRAGGSVQMQVGDLSQLAERRYWAFLSYSHADSGWAEWLFRALEAFTLPGKLVGADTVHGPAPRRLRPIFRDRDELEASANLGARLTLALQQSRSLIVMCSPASARSQWVNEEVVRFRQMHGDRGILAVIVDGEPFASVTGDHPERECFPPALRQAIAEGATTLAEHIQPIAADLRPEGDGKRLAVLKLVAGVLGVGLDQLIDRDTRRRQRQLAALAAASLVGMGVTTTLAVTAVLARNEARAQQAQAEGLVEFMLTDVRKTLEPVGKLDALGAIGDRAMRYYASQGSRRLDADSLGRRARVLHLLGEVAEQRGDLPAALKSFKEASESTAELVKRWPNNEQLIFDHAQSEYWVGYVAERRGERTEAASRFRDYKRFADRLVQANPKKDEWQLEVAYANTNLGIVLLDQANAAEAAAAFERALVTKQELVRRAPADRARLSSLGQGYAWQADALAKLGRSKDALAARLSERRIYQTLLIGTNDDAGMQQALNVNRMAVSRLLVAGGELGAAVEELRSAKSSAAELTSRDPQNMSYLEDQTNILIQLGEIELASGNTVGAAEDAAQATTLAAKLAATDPSVIDWSGSMLGGARLLRIRAACQEAESQSALVAALTPAQVEFERLVRTALAHPSDLRIARIAGEAAILAGDRSALAGDVFEARDTWNQGAKAVKRALSGSKAPQGKSAALIEVLAQRQESSIHSVDEFWNNVRGRYSW